MKNIITINNNTVLNRFELNINGWLITSQIENFFQVPLSIVKNIRITEFPRGLTIKPIRGNTSQFEEDYFISPGLKNLDGKKAYVDFNNCPYLEEVAHNTISYPLFQETLVDLLLMNKQLKPAILMNGFDGSSFHFHCSIELPDNTIEILFQTTLDFYYSPAERLVEAGKKIRKFLREEVGLPADPSDTAKLSKIIEEDSE
jgi:hypothetical protein